MDFISYKSAFDAYNIIRDISKLALVSADVRAERDEALMILKKIVENQNLSGEFSSSIDEN